MGDQLAKFTYLRGRKPTYLTEVNASKAKNFFEIEDGAIITVNGDTFCAMVTNILVLALRGIDANDVRFQQDSVTC